MKNTLKKIVCAFGMCAALGPVGQIQVVSAEDDIRDLMTMDRHLVESDFIGVIRIESAEFVPGETGIPVRRVVSAIVEDVWATRWTTEAGQELALGTSADAGGLFTPGDRYVVLLAGGPWNDSPLTQRGHSIFRIQQDGTMMCHEGTRLYAAQTTGFLCSIPELVVGDPATVGELRSQVLLRLERARARLTTLDAHLSTIRRALETRPMSVRSSEVRR